MRRAGVIAGLLALMLVLRDAVFVQLRLFDALPELVLLVVVAVALMEGPEMAAIVGFAGGLLQDMATTYTPLGISALSFVIVGFAVGVAHGYVIRPGRLLGPALAAAATFAALILSIIVGGLVGQEFLVSGYQVRVAVMASCYSAAAFPVVLPLTRRVLEASRMDRATV
jgi:rod shape-determining protein MreD